MATQHDYDTLMTKPLPSRTPPRLVILILLAALFFGHKYFFGQPKTLLGGPPPANQYSQYMVKPKKAPPVVAVPQPTPGPVQDGAVPAPVAAHDNSPTPAVNETQAVRVEMPAPSTPSPSRGPITPAPLPVAHPPASRP